MCACQTFALVLAAATAAATASRRQRCALTKTLAQQWPKSWPSGAAAVSDAMSQQRAAPPGMAGRKLCRLTNLLIRMPIVNNYTLLRF